MKRGLFENYRVRDGREARRYWIHDRILVGGEIVSPEDGEHLARDAGMTHCLSLVDDPTGIDRLPDRVKTLTVPCGDKVSTGELHTMLDWAHAAVRDPKVVIYCHCAIGDSPSAAIAWMLMRSVCDQTSFAATDAVRSGRGTFMAPLIRATGRNVWLPKGCWEPPPDLRDAIDAAMRTYVPPPASPEPVPQPQPVTAQQPAQVQAPPPAPTPPVQQTTPAPVPSAPGEPLSVSSTRH